MTAMNDNRLLIVDDDEDTCSNLSDILTDLGYLVDVAYRALDGLDLLKQNPYRLALLDYKLPCMTGVELFQRMRQIDTNVAGLLVTAFASRETEREALSAGLRQVVSKPVEMSQFLPLIEQALA
jgi:two-component system, NtrC family, response regulator HydG